VVIPAGAWSAGRVPGPWCCAHSPRRCRSAGVTADAAYGQEWRFRRMLETAVGYVLAVPKSQQIPRFGRVDHLFTQAPDGAVVRQEWSGGRRVRLVPVSQRAWRRGQQVIAWVLCACGGVWRVRLLSRAAYI
jgi:hypothetical protein